MLLLALLPITTGKVSVLLVQSECRAEITDTVVINSPLIAAMFRLKINKFYFLIQL